MCVYKICMISGLILCREELDLYILRRRKYLSVENYAKVLLKQNQSAYPESDKASTANSTSRCNFKKCCIFIHFFLIMPYYGLLGPAFCSAIFLSRCLEDLCGHVKSKKYASLSVSLVFIGKSCR